MIDAGCNIDDTIKNAINTADVILLLVTDSFMASHYCMHIELENAMKREKQGKCIVVPVMFQETVFSDIISFAKNNRVPEDGKPIATGFKNQQLGCTHAVNMLKTMIDHSFPKCKKIPLTSPNKKKYTEENKKNVVQALTIQLYKNGKPENIPLTQNMLDLIPKYHNLIRLGQLWINLYVKQSKDTQDCPNNIRKKLYLSKKNYINFVYILWIFVLIQKHILLRMLE